MILIISTNKEKELGYYEFVLPIINIIKKLNKDYEIINYKDLNNIDYDKYNKIIISGTHIMDFDYLNYIENFRSIIDYNIKTLAICSGSQIIAKILGYNLYSYDLIGKYEVKIVKDNFYSNKNFNSYFIITKIPNIDNKNFDIYGYVNNIPVFYRYNNVYITLFHPEVLNENLIISFIKNI